MIISVYLPQKYKKVSTNETRFYFFSTQFLLLGTEQWTEMSETIFAIYIVHKVSN